MAGLEKKASEGMASCSQCMLYGNTLPKDLSSIWQKSWDSPGFSSSARTEMPVWWPQDWMDTLRTVTQGSNHIFLDHRLGEFSSLSSCDT